MKIRLLMAVMIASIVAQVSPAQLEPLTTDKLVMFWPLGSADGAPEGNPLNQSFGVHRPGGFDAFMRDRIEPYYRLGIRRFILHNPMGNEPGGPMDLDQFADQIELGREWNAREFVEAVRSAPDSMPGISFIVYVGMREAELTQALETGQHGVHLTRIYLTLLHVLEAGDHVQVAFDAASTYVNDDPERHVVELVKSYKAREGLLTYIEAMPKSGDAYSWQQDHPYVCLERFYDRNRERALGIDAPEVIRIYNDPISTGRWDDKGGDWAWIADCIERGDTPALGWHWDGRVWGGLNASQIVAAANAQAGVDRPGEPVDEEPSRGPVRKTISSDNVDVERGDDAPLSRPDEDPDDRGSPPSAGMINIAPGPASSRFDDLADFTLASDRTVQLNSFRFGLHVSWDRYPSREHARDRGERVMREAIEDHPNALLFYLDYDKGDPGWLWSEGEHDEALRRQAALAGTIEGMRAAADKAGVWVGMWGLHGGNGAYRARPPSVLAEQERMHAEIVDDLHYWFVPCYNKSVGDGTGYFTPTRTDTRDVYMWAYSRMASAVRTAGDSGVIVAPAFNLVCAANPTCRGTALPPLEFATTAEACADAGVRIVSIWDQMGSTTGDEWKEQAVLAAGWAFPILSHTFPRGGD